MATQTKRTRSQTTLDTFFRPQQFDVSPLKFARTAAKTSHIHASTSQPSGMEAGGSGVSDDERISRKGKEKEAGIARLKKRSSSSLERDDVVGLGEERLRKKAKHDGLNEGPSRPLTDGVDHPKIFPSPRRPAGPFDFTVLTPRKRTPSSPAQSPSTPSRRRAVSVPASSSPEVPHLDLRQLHSSPQRAPSTSPIRPVLRFTSVPRVFRSDDDDMEVDPEPGLSTPIPSLKLPQDVETPHIPLEQPTLLAEDSVPLWTPRALAFDSSLSSPLTPIPPTPASTRPPIPSMLDSFLVGLSTPRASFLEPENEATPRAVFVPPVVETLPTATDGNDEIAPTHDAPTPQMAIADPVIVTPEAVIPEASLSSSLSLSDATPSDTAVSPEQSSSQVADTPSAPIFDDALSATHDPEQSTPSVAPSTSSLPISRLPRPSNYRRQDDSSSLSPLSSDTEDEPTSETPRAVDRLPVAPVEIAKKGRHPMVSGSSRGRGRGKQSLTGRPAVPASRLTRSTSLKQQKQQKPDANDQPAVTKPGTIPAFYTETKAKSVASSSSSTSQSNSRPTSTVPTAKSFSFSYAAPTASSQIRASEKSPSKKPISLPKPPSSKPTSPVKPASTAGSWARPQASKLSSLSNLSQALEKLKMPNPRPVTSLGFNGSSSHSSDAGSGAKAAHAKDDSHIGRSDPVAGSSKLVAPALGRTSTLPVIGSKPATASTTRPFALPSYKPAGAAGPSRINLGSGVVAGRKNFFGGPMRTFEKVSKKSSLPVVLGSPVKGGQRTDVADEGSSVAGPSGSGTMAPPVAPMDLSGTTVPLDSRLHVGIVDRPNPRKRDDSRRASMASELITQTLAELPQTPSPTKPSSKARASETARSGSPTARAKSLRSASGGSRSAPGAPGKGAGTGAHVSASGSNSSGAASGSGSGNGKKKTVSLKVLKSCTIFVDVKTGSGDDAGGLFVDMLRGLGARILGSAGSTCTHIVFKNGAAGTLTRYRLMDEPKPFVVGIAWVVECVEQMTKVDESKFLVDLEHLYVAGGNKRRRSMLPKQLLYTTPRTPPNGSMLPPPIPHEAAVGDQSSPSSAGDSDLSTSSIVMDDDDDLPPLERARKRRTMMAMMKR